MGKLLIVTACLYLMNSGVQAQVPDEVTKKITAAKDAFYAERDKAEQALLAALERKEATAKQVGDIKTIEAVRAEIEAFRKEGALPKSVPLGTYETAIKFARSRLETAYLNGIKAYTQKNEIEKGKVLQEELEKIAKDTNIKSPKLISKPASKPVDGPLQAETLWTNDSGHSFSIAERSGDAFRGLFVYGHKVIIEMQGTVKDDKIMWLGKDSRALRGKQGGDYLGTVSTDANGLFLQLNWHEPDGTAKKTGFRLNR